MKRTLTGVARKLRKDSTDVERLFWNRVRNRRLDGFKFKRQHEIVGYVVDFICTEARLIVELDGGQHASSIDDRRRDDELKREDYRVLRFWNNDVLMNLDGVIEIVLKTLREPSP